MYLPVGCANYETAVTCDSCNLGVMPWIHYIAVQVVLQSSLHDRMDTFLKRMEPNNPADMTLRGRR